MRDRFLAVLTHLSKPFVVIPGALVIAGGIAGFAWYTTSVSPQGMYVAALIAPITQEVDVSSTVKATEDTSLSFQATGQVARIAVVVGQHVSPGQTLVSLNTASQTAALEQAKANLEMQQAKLASLKAGTRPEQIALDQTAVTQADAALLDAIRNAYINANDAIYAKSDPLFTNPRTTSITFIPSLPDAQLLTRIQNERTALEPLLVMWQAGIASSSSGSGAAGSAQTNMNAASAYLNDLATALSEAVPGGSMSAAALATYQTNVNTARLNVSGALSALTAANTADATAHGALILAQAGATTNDLAAQAAQVDAAQAAVDLANVALSQTEIRAPLAGTVTQQDAHLGQTVAPGTPLIHMIADGKFEAEAYVSEADIAHLVVGNTVEAHLDAYQDTPFLAVVTSIDPAATIQNGVSAYKVTVTFAQNDQRIKSGLTANLRIIAAKKEAALIIPTSAIITDNNQKFVYVQKGTAPTKVAIQTGIQGTGGMTEVTSGLTAGDRVLTFGARAR